MINQNINNINNIELFRKKKKKNLFLDANITQEKAKK